MVGVCRLARTYTGLTPAAAFNQVGVDVGAMVVGAVVLQGRTLGLMSAAAFAQQDVEEKHREGHCGVTLGVKTFLLQNSIK